MYEIRLKKITFPFHKRGRLASVDCVEIVNVISAPDCLPSNNLLLFTKTNFNDKRTSFNWYSLWKRL